jgi:agmatine/peptidylarginine deiminase
MLLFSCNKEKSTSDFFMPGEFEAQEAVWLGWQGYEPYYQVRADGKRR